MNTPEIIYHDSNRIFIKRYMDNERYIHNDNGPAFEQYYVNGNLNQQIYGCHGMYNNTCNPANILFIQL